MIIRKIQHEIEKALNRQAAVAIIGARQVGKTTTALEKAIKPNQAWVIYPGKASYPINENMTCISLVDFMQEAEKY